ncbi:MAG: hypothetical protein MZV70_36200 [Desulfobacterales bacterium]|nr:hypothetical protein [Desulfobacterales bacterium]
MRLSRTLSVRLPGGQSTFAPETPYIELKKILWDTYEEVKKTLELDEGGKSVVSDAEIWAMILDDEEVGPLARKYVRKKGKKQEEEPGPETPAIENDAKAGVSNMAQDLQDPMGLDPKDLAQKIIQKQRGLGQGQCSRAHHSDSRESGHGLH